MKEMLVRYASYHYWANGLLLDLIKALPETHHRQEVRSSFSSLYTTILHMLDAENIWWQRLKLQEHVTRPSDSFTGSMKELSDRLMQQSKQWQEWVVAASEPQLLHEFKYQNSKRESFKQPVYQVLLHIFNHGTYHRGQLVTILRQLGVEKIPQTDFIVWSRKK